MIKKSLTPITIFIVITTFFVYGIFYHEWIKQEIDYDIDENSYQIITYAHIGINIVASSYLTTGRSYHIYKHAEGDINEIALKEREKMKNAIEIYESKMRAVK